MIAYSNKQLTSKLFTSLLVNKIIMLLKFIMETKILSVDYGREGDLPPKFDQAKC
jgi:hypothetical protein